LLKVLHISPKPHSPSWFFCQCCGAGATRSQNFWLVPEWSWSRNEVSAPGSGSDTKRL
jgi:hypothetical protein